MATYNMRDRADEHQAIKFTLPFKLFHVAGYKSLMSLSIQPFHTTAFRAVNVCVLIDPRHHIVPQLICINMQILSQSSRRGLTLHRSITWYHRRAAEDGRSADQTIEGSTIQRSSQRAV